MSDGVEAAVRDVIGGSGGASQGLGQIQVADSGLAELVAELGLQCRKSGQVPGWADSQPFQEDPVFGLADLGYVGNQ